MEEIKVNINAPTTNITVASSINTKQYIQSQNTENRDSSIEKLSPDLLEEEKKVIPKVDEIDNNESDLTPPNLITPTEKSPNVKRSARKRREKKEKNTSPFEDLIDNNIPQHKRIQIAKICKNVFGNNDKKKEYAILYCFLREKNSIKCDRKVFFKAWYNYIGKDFPKDLKVQDSELEGIYTNMSEDDIKGYIFKDRYDEKKTDYFKKIKEFEEQLILKELAL